MFPSQTESGKTSPNVAAIPRSLKPSESPVTSETPWRCFTIRMGSDIIAPSSSQIAPSQSTTVPDANILILYSSLVASPTGELYTFGGDPGPRGLFRLELDSHNSVATMRSVYAAGVNPSTRNGHTAVWISHSLMVVWGGFEISSKDGDANIHVFNASKT